MKQHAITIQLSRREAGILLHLLAGMLGKLRCMPIGKNRNYRKLRRAIGQHKYLWRRIRAARHNHIG